jgi:murein DD-endopeptidase MepM/ murein hydrolase activator NlpD
MFKQNGSVMKNCEQGVRWIGAMCVAAVTAACGGGGGGTASTSAPVVAANTIVDTIGSQAKSVSSTDQQVALSFPAGAVQSEIKLNVAPALNPATSDSNNIGNNYIYKLEPDGTSFVKPVAISVKISPADLSEEWSLAPYTLSNWNGIAWENLTTSTDDNLRSVTAEISHFSYKGLTVRTGQEPPVETPNDTWINSSNCFTAFNNSNYTSNFNRLSQSLFNLTSPPTTGVGCLTNPFLAKWYSYFIPSMENHGGLDFRAPVGTPVYSPFDGVVILQDLDILKGKSTLTVKSNISGTNYNLMYLHCRKHNVPLGGAVSKGQQICESGSVGAPAHLHLESRVDGNDSGNLRAMSGSRGVCPTKSFIGFNTTSRQFDLTRSPGCTYADISQQNIDPVALFSMSAGVLQAITFNSPGNQIIGTSPPGLVASSTSGLPVALNSTSPLVCTVSGTALTLVSSGTCTVIATQIGGTVGGTTYAAAVPVTRNFAITSPSISYGGTYACSFSGGDTGTFTVVTPTPYGTFTSCYGSSFYTGSFSCTGNVSSAGVITNAIASSGTTAIGTATASGASGTWSNVSASGSFSCTRSTSSTGLPSGYVSQGGLTWSPISGNLYSWTSANNLCTNASYLGQSGWRLPTSNELISLRSSGSATSAGWFTLSSTWSSTPSTTGTHVNVYLGGSTSMSAPDSAPWYVTCVK